MNIKASVFLIVALAAASVSNSCWSAEGWLLLSKDGRQSLVYAKPNGFQLVVELGNISVYANEEKTLGILTRDTGLRAGKLLLIDKELRQVQTTWPVYVYPISQLIGSTEDLRLIDGYAYFVSVRLDSEGHFTSPNTRGGYFDLSRVSIASGDVESYPMPREITNPRLTDADGHLIIYADRGEQMWTFSDAKKLVESIAGNIHVNFAKLRDFGNANPADKFAADAIPGTVTALPDESEVFVDRSNVIRRSYKTGVQETLWKLNELSPGVTPAMTRVIELH
jgi:hypothetical protein